MFRWNENKQFERRAVVTNKAKHPLARSCPPPPPTKPPPPPPNRETSDREAKQLNTVASNCPTFKVQQVVLQHQLTHVDATVCYVIS